MPRVARKLSNSQVYHVMVRGNEKKSIFLDDEDRLKFVSVLGEKKKETGFSLYAWCLMNNHVHLLLKEGSEPIRLIMKRINVSYALHFNRKYDRVGHVFQDRYRSEPVESERYLLQLIRYIHNNPVRANVVGSPSQYFWSSYNALTGQNAFCREMIDRKDVLELFSLDESRAAETLREHVTGGNPDLGERTNEFFHQFFQEFLFVHNLTLGFRELMGNKHLRQVFIREYKLKSGLSDRKIAEHLGINKNMVNRVK